MVHLPNVQSCLFVVFTHFLEMHDIAYCQHKHGGQHMQSLRRHCWVGIIQSFWARPGDGCMDGKMYADAMKGDGASFA